VLGATGSIGASTLDLVRRNPDAFRVEALTAHAQVDQLAALAREFSARVAVVADPARLDELRAALAGSGVEAAAGPDALVEASHAGPTSPWRPLSAAPGWPRRWPRSSAARPWRWPTRKRWFRRAT
jgi:1-deoxy-D-xylulose 5-phosphate reductoisomerase